MLQQLDVPQNLKYISTTRKLLSASEKAGLVQLTRIREPSMHHSWQYQPCRHQPRRFTRLTDHQYLAGLPDLDHVEIRYEVCGTCGTEVMG